MLGEKVNARVLTNTKRVVGVVIVEKTNRIRVLDKATGKTYLCSKDSVYKLETTNKAISNNHFSAQNKNIKDLMFLHKHSINTLAFEADVNAKQLEKAINEDYELHPIDYKKIESYYKVKRGFFKEYGRAVHGTDFFRIIVSQRLKSVRRISGYSVKELVKKVQDKKIISPSHLKRVEDGRAELPKSFELSLEVLLNIPKGSLSDLRITDKERKLALTTLEKRGIKK